jgi:ribosomal protein S27E
MITPVDRTAHRERVRRVIASGIIPPRRCSRPYTCAACGDTWTPTTVGVSRWTTDAGPLWWSHCPGCGSMQTVYTRLRREA